MKNGKIFWLREGSMMKFHAFTLDSGVSLCDKWFLGGRATANDWHESNGEKSKCEECNAELNNRKEKVVFT